MKKLVVIDDEFIVVEGIKAMIARLQIAYEVVGFAYDGISGYEVIEKTKPDLVITDIRIPGLDGLSLIEQAKEILPDSVFVVISGYQEFEYARKAILLGVRGYIDKPITMDKLKDLFEQLEEEQNRKRESFAETQTENGCLNTAGATPRLTEQLLEEIKRGDSAAVRSVVAQILKEWKKEINELDRYKEEAYKMVCVSIGIFFEEHADHEMEKHFPSYKNLELLTSIEEVDHYVCAILERILEKMEARNTGSTHQTILKLLAYINNNYGRDIGLNELADMVRMNPAYLSILFKDEVGTSYIKYLTRIRLDNAKRLLLEGYKVAEVSEMVGYHNYRYFCDIFKKSEGETPSEYKGVRRKEG